MIEMIEQISIDLSNYCSKQCPFCYNHSRPEGATRWRPSEVIRLATDCIAPGVRAVCTTRACPAGDAPSAAPWGGFNLADHVGDAPQAVASPRAALAACTAGHHKGLLF